MPLDRRGSMMSHLGGEQMAWRATAFGLVWALTIWVFGGLEFLWAHNLHCVHKEMSLALMEGNLRYPRPLVSQADGVADLEVYNGALFTHWGYGVPLLQLPFHFLMKVVSPGAEPA